MTANEITINRDFDNDVLYVMKHGIKKDSTVNISLNPEILVRLDPETRKVVGFTIEDFSKVLPLLAKHPDVQIIKEFNTIIDFINVSNLINKN